MVPKKMTAAVQGRPAQQAPTVSAVLRNQHNKQTEHSKAIRTTTKALKRLYRVRKTEYPQLRSSAVAQDSSRTERGSRDQIWCPCGLFSNYNNSIKLYICLIKRSTRAITCTGTRSAQCACRMRCIVSPVAGWGSAVSAATSHADLVPNRVLNGSCTFQSPFSTCWYAVMPYTHV